MSTGVNVMSKNEMSMCYPYGMGVSCICDARGRIYKCFPSHKSVLLDDHHDLTGEAMLSRDDRADGSAGDGFGGGGDHALGMDSLTDAAGLGGARRRGNGPNNGLDERTEIILAATFLVLIILAFIR